ncbi:ABC transporter permease [Enemella evansiae]|uniref:ABC transporter permease n=1 Tax=Enemella evansiae TaxID=2016499 RepID=UPI000B97A4A5|nr:ABC transporter permease [Enemella evansiae]PFG66509.1 peptide/nickel transport system permease protein [Propionibacteriaceae bacterium ES.041]OYN93347.1 peptide ABC transporter permease [Enemella evansiae]OYN94419.1 peptide ABC transporter permease [Enemella evansiae]OYO05972.1 peptide ABC transporter permease [Enemella evansiae]OYO11280.1 peptide ABC transporter permease [Enemella evansiae]
MLRFVVRRLLLMIPVLLGLSLLLFAWLRALPGDPASALLGDKATPEAVARINAQYGFDQPIPVQYVTWLGQLIRGDFGSSPRTGQPVVGTFLERFPATVELSVAALIFAIVVGIPLGYFAAKRAGGILDTIAVTNSLIGVVIPVFVLAYLLKLVFAVGIPGLEFLAVLPTSGRQNVRLDATHITNFYVLDGLLTREWDASWDAIKHLILPAIALGSIPLAAITRMTRASVLDVLNEDYVRTATAKGLPQGLITRRHVLKNAMLPIVTLIGLQTGALLSGAVLTEGVFAFNGIGSYLFEAISSLDYAVLQGFILFIAIIYALVNLVVDLLYGVFDPRMRVT